MYNRPMKRTTNKKILREWLRVNGKGSLERLAYESGCSASLIQKITSETYSKVPMLSHIDGICRVTGFNMNELFPLEEPESA